MYVFYPFVYFFHTIFHLLILILYDLNIILMYNYIFIAYIHFRNLYISVFINFHAFLAFFFYSYDFLAACMIIRGRGYVFSTNSVAVSP